MANVKENRRVVKNVENTSAVWTSTTDAVQDQAGGSIPTNMAAAITNVSNDDEMTAPTDVKACVDAIAACAIEDAEVAVHQATVSVRIDEVFEHITAFRAITDNSIPESSLLGKSLRAQANALFNQAFLNLQARLGFAEAYVDTPGNMQSKPGLHDITDVIVHEVLRLQRILK